MLVNVDQQTKKSMEQDGSYLKFLRSTGGVGITLVVCGLCFGGFAAFVGILLGLMLDTPSMIPASVAVGVGLAVVFGVPGYILRKKRINGYLEHFAKESGYTVHDMSEFDAEFDRNEVVVFTAFNKLNKQAKLLAGIFTDHWVKLPGIGISRVCDIAAIWWEHEPYYKGTKRGKTCFFLRSNGEIVLAGVEEHHTQEITAELVKRNPRIITARMFQYDGQTYDVLEQPEEVAALYRSVSAGQ